MDCNKHECSDSSFFNFKKADYIEICQALRSVNWENELNNSDLNISVDNFYHIIYKIIEEHVPMQKYRNFKFPIYFNSTLKQLIFDKKLVHKRFKQTNNTNHYEIFKSLRKQCETLAHSLHTQYLEDTEKNLAKNPKLFWSYIKNRKQTRGLPEVMYLNDSISSNNAEIANLFAKNFSSVYSREIVVPPEFPSDHFVGTDRIILRSYEVEKELGNLGEKTPGGPDNIKAIFFLKCAQFLSGPLTRLFNESLQAGIFPDKWKVAFILPVHKTGKKHDIKNYRPVCNISIIPKIFEKLVHLKIDPLIKPLIIKNQYGFIKNRSTVSNLVSFSNYINNALENKQQIDVMYADFSKAYDKVIHSLLISKIQSIGISNPLLKWMHSFLTGRTQIVKVQDALSEPIQVTSGCIQGGHISCLLFSLFINDIQLIFPHVKFWLFADDLKLAVEVRGPSDAGILQEALTRLHTWCLINHMELNISKCSIVSYHTIQNPYIATYYINNQVLSRQARIRDLGVTFENNMKFTTHIQAIRSKAMQMLGFVFRNSREFSNVTTLKTLFFAYVRSVLEYASVVWSPHYKYQIKSLEAVQHKFLRLIAFKTKFLILNHDYKEIEKEFNILNLETRRQFYDLIFLHKLIHSKIYEPDLLENLQIKVRTRQTRDKSTFKLPTCRTNVAENSTLIRCQKLWNLAGDEGVDVFSDRFNDIFDLISEGKMPFSI